MSDDKGSGWAILVFVVIVTLGVGFWVFTSYMESAAYNRLTGANTTTLDAMFVELRVQSAPKEQP